MNFKHGGCGTTLYSRWHSMKNRCYNKNVKAYHNYGGRGITVCDDWLSSFSNFKGWAENNGFNPNLELDRIDNNLGYHPENCRWVTIKTQNRNQRRITAIMAFGEAKLLTDWVKDHRCVVKRHTLMQRLKNKWPIELALTTPAKLGRNQYKR